MSGSKDKVEEKEGGGVRVHVGSKWVVGRLFGHRILEHAWNEGCWQ